MRSVFVISKGSHDYSKAETFGEIVFLSDEAFDPVAANNMYKKFWQHLRLSHANDLILVTGLPIMVGIACGIMVSLHNKLNLLVYKDDKYLERNIIFNKEK